MLKPLSSRMDQRSPAARDTARPSHDDIGESEAIDALFRYRELQQAILERETSTRALGTMTEERDGYRNAYLTVVAERDAANNALSTMTAERDGYRTAYQAVLAERDLADTTRERPERQFEALRSRVEETFRQLQSIEALHLLQAAKTMYSKRGSVFTSRPQPGIGQSYMVCNSIPKAGTYLLLALISKLGAHTDIGYHTYSSSLRRVSADGKFEAERKVPGLMWAQDLSPGYLCASHLEYCPYVEQYFQSRTDHKMILMIRDPRDLVISWVDFVYYSAAYGKMTAWNAYSSEQGKQSYPDDASRITSSILSLTETGLHGYYPWIASPVCKIVKFEDLYGELAGLSAGATATPTIDGICAYLDLAKPAPETLISIIGHGLTASRRTQKIGIHKARMNSEQLELINAPAFRRMVLELGYI